MNDEQTNAPNTDGDETDKTLEIQTPAESQEEQYKKLKERNNKIQEELIRSENLKSEALLGGTTGGHIENRELTEEERKKSGAAKFFKGTELERAILDEKK